MNKPRLNSLFKSVVKPLSLALVVCLSASCSNEKEALNSPQQTISLIAAPIELKVGEGFKAPVGYYESTPRFSWQMPQNSQSSAQSAYQIQVSSTPELFSTQPDLWDSSKINSTNTSWIHYQGQPLSSRQQVYWRVRLWDESDKASRWSDVQTLELGLLKNEDWQAKWIGHPDTALANQPSKDLIATPQYFRKSFTLSNKVADARLYITAKGVFKPYINGDEVSAKDVMTPGWTPYSQRIETLTYDLTDKLNLGENTIAASLAGGWYSARVADLKEPEHTLPPRLLAQLEITLIDGTKQTITTDETWKATQQGPIRFASNYDGERYDQAFEMPNWNRTKFDSSSWQNAYAQDIDNAIKLRPKRHEPIRIVDELSPIALLEHNENSVIFDFGQNMVGVPRLNIPVVANQQVKVEFAEALHKGEFYTDNYRSALSTNFYSPAKTEFIQYQPTFTFHGYRYIKLSGFDASKAPSKDWVTSLVQHSDIKLYNNFNSSHPKLNKLFSNINWGLRGNFYDIPLDCPQRDERLGWTGDANAFVTPSMYIADVYGFWSAWLESMREEQANDGMIPLYVPFITWIDWASSGWGDAATIIPWELYTMTGDETILAENYDMMKKWVDYHTSQSTNSISKMKTFGDWLQPYPKAEGKGANRGDTDFNLIGTAFYARSVELTLKAATVLQKQADIDALSALHARIKNAFRTHFFDEQLTPKKGEATQTAYLLALEFNLFNAQEKLKAQELLIALIGQADNHLRTGFLGTPLLTSVLQDAGRSDLIYQLLFKETYPSWFYSINNGATTTWERWNSYSLEDGFNPQGMNSLNHYAYGTVSRWFYEGILGIQQTLPGFKEFKVSPQFSHYLDQANGTVHTMNGEIEINWFVKADEVSINLVVPKNSAAILDLTHLQAVTVSQNGIQISNHEKLTPGEYQINGKL
ncbi:family 78 glycoside hydrolase catalytic domain [Pseudoalteromonas haloplanktis]|uniref:alpha-L-rhamnosidase n=1 Tax=Pseudoalteromonas haloplanktis TaxID=228 RepID=A0ABU1BHX0_PSEHA|nr:family 78 glycoside hydrolase catalytic domain [Pseudoalteromonas haloplanktis]MDQ9094068.1 family 78 glycoside hydrolase catalytic domain [Pseudoalteromonas haloplanktis]